jgi:hypothetical protein
MKVSSCLSLLLLLAVNACSPAPMPVSQSPHDPSNPNAPEGAAAPPSAGDSPSPVADEHALHEQAHGVSGDADAGAHSADAGPTDAVYVCPMHAHVTSPGPGRCPECGMNLVPKK